MVLLSEKKIYDNGAVLKRLTQLQSLHNIFDSNRT